MPRKYIAFVLTTLLVIGFDQGTKIWVRDNLTLWTDSIDVVEGLFQIVHYQNTGAAFGMADGMMWLFAVFTLFALGLMAWMTYQLEDDDAFVATMMGLIAGGAVGNAIDRVLYQAVTDFLRFYRTEGWLYDTLTTQFNTAEWPSFNIADAAIVVGIIVFFIQQLIQDWLDKKAGRVADDGLDGEDLPDLAAEPET
jgi:signal peptidase II